VYLACCKSPVSSVSFFICASDGSGISMPEVASAAIPHFLGEKDELNATFFVGPFAICNPFEAGK
jgi:hypothetical protein